MDNETWGPFVTLIASLIALSFIISYGRAFWRAMQREKEMRQREEWQQLRANPMWRKQKPNSSVLEEETND